MDKKTLILLILVLAIIGITIKVFLFSPKGSFSTPQSSGQARIDVEPSKSVKNYADSAGFSFSYPDNLSLLNNELKDANTYADLQLIAKAVEGSFHLNIADSKFKSLDDWVNKIGSKEAPKEVKLGNLKALEVTAADKVMLGSLDSGVFFNLETTFGGNKDYWMNVYRRVLQDFTFSQPAAEAGSPGEGSADSVSFEGEEVVE